MRTKALRTVAAMLGFLLIGAGAHGLLVDFGFFMPRFGVTSAAGNEIALYADPQLTVPLQYDVDLGGISRGSTFFFTFYIKNIGGSTRTLNMTVLSFPFAPHTQYLEWNREGYLLLGGSSVDAVIALTVPNDPSIEGRGYSFIIYIFGRQV